MARVLSRDAAQELTDRINDEAVNWKLVMEAWNNSIWLTYNLIDWEDYCTAHIDPPMPVGQRIFSGSPEDDVRLTNLRNLREQGMPVWAIAAAYRASSSNISYLLHHKAKVPRKGDGQAAEYETRKPSRVPVVKTLRKPMVDITRGARRIGVIMNSSPRQITDNRETLRNLYLTELRLASQQIDAAIEALQK